MIHNHIFFKKNVCFQIASLLYLNNRFNPYEWKNRSELCRASSSLGDTFNLSGSLWFSFTTLTGQGLL